MRIFLYKIHNCFTHTYFYIIQLRTIPLYENKTQVK